MEWCAWTSRRSRRILISYLLVPCWPLSARDIRDQTGFEQRHQKFCIDWFSWRETQVFPRGGFYSSSHLYQSYPFAPIDPTDPEDKLNKSYRYIPWFLELKFQQKKVLTALIFQSNDFMMVIPLWKTCEMIYLDQILKVGWFGCTLLREPF